MANLEKAFDAEMMGIYTRAKAEVNYNASIFHRMLTDHGGLETAKRLINSPNPSDGYTALWERHRLDLTVESLVVDNPEWHPLFSSEELAKAKKRLNDYGYSPSKGLP